MKLPAVWFRRWAAVESATPSRLESVNHGPDADPDSVGFPPAIRPPVFDDKTFQRRLAIDQGRHNITVSCFLAIVQNNDVAVENVGVYHRIAPHFQCKHSRVLRCISL